MRPETRKGIINLTEVAIVLLENSTKERLEKLFKKAKSKFFRKNIGIIREHFREIPKGEYNTHENICQSKNSAIIILYLCKLISDKWEKKRKRRKKEQRRKKK